MAKQPQYEIDIISASEKLSEEFNKLSEGFIKFSLAYNNLTKRIREREENHPTIFTD